MLLDLQSSLLSFDFSDKIPYAFISPILLFCLSSVPSDANCGSICCGWSTHHEASHYTFSSSCLRRVATMGKAYGKQRTHKCRGPQSYLNKLLFLQYLKVHPLVGLNSRACTRTELKNEYISLPHLASWWYICTLTAVFYFMRLCCVN